MKTKPRYNAVQTHEDMLHTAWPNLDINSVTGQVNFVTNTTTFTAILYDKVAGYIVQHLQWEHDNSKTTSEELHEQVAAWMSANEALSTRK